VVNEAGFDMYDKQLEWWETMNRGLCTKLKRGITLQGGNFEKRDED